MKVAHCGSGQLAVHQGTGEAKYPPRAPTYGGRAAYKEAVEQVHLSVMFPTIPSGPHTSVKHGLVVGSGTGVTSWSMDSTFISPSWH